MNGTHIHRLRSATVLAITTLAGIAVTVLLLELGARALFPKNVPAMERVAFIRYDSLLGWSHRPGISVPFVQPDFRTTVTINSLGLRDVEPRAPSADSTDPVAAPGLEERTVSKRRMLMLGDSFAWGFGVEYGERVSEILEQLHPDLEVINAGVNGYGSDQELLYLRERTSDLYPDLVLLLFHPNDFQNNAAAEQYWYYKPFFKIVDGRLELRNVPVPVASLGQRLRRLVLGRSYLGQSLFTLWIGVAGDKRVGEQPDASPHGGRGSSAVSDAVTVRLIQEIHAECAARELLLILVSTPMKDELRATVASTSANAGIPYHALDDAFAAAGSDATHFDHDEHWTALGHRVAAQSISVFLESAGLLDRDGSGAVPAP